MAARFGFAVRWLVCIVAVTAWSGPVHADTNTSLGDRSGEGSTPFTGLAQTPEANLFTGASGTSIKIEVPPGRKNVTPKLAMQYSSSGGPSPYGFGWDLPLGRIQRSTKWGAPRACGYSCSLTGNACGSSSDCPQGESCIATDQFVLSLPSGAVELVATSPGANTYRPKVEESYTQVTKDTVNNTWTAYDRSGLIYTFGAVASARTGTDTSVFAQTQSGTCHFTGEWALTQVQDPNGNYMSITYNSWYNVLYPASVDYGGNLNTSQSHFYHVAFNWETRPDLIENNLLSGPAVLTERLTGIVVTTDVPTTGTLVRGYNFAYDDAPNGQTGYRSILSTAQLVYGFLSLPPQTFAHAPSDAGLHTAQTVTAPAGITALRVVDTSQDVSQSLLDMNRDGIADIVKSSSSAWTVYTNTHSGFSSAWTWTLPSTGLGHFGANEFTYLRDVEVSTGACSTDGNGNFTHCTDRDTMDLNGDGIPDFIDASASPWVVYFGQLQQNPTSGGTLGSFSPGVQWPIPAIYFPYLRVDKGSTVPSLHYWSSTTVQDLIDINGDGLPDLVVAGGTTWYVYLNTGHSFQTTALSFPAPNGSTSLDSSFGYTDSNGNALETWSTLGMMDMNGDGLPDVVINTPADYQCQSGVCQATDSDLNVYYNTGQGFATAPVAFVIPPDWGFRYSYQGATYHDIVDINGDGLPDWVGVGPDGSGYTSQWYALLNQGGNFEPLEGTEQVVDWVPCGYGQCPVIFTINVAGPNQTWTGGSGPIRQTTVSGNPQYTLIDLFDINGDGMLDRVNTNSSSNWSMQVNQNSTRPNLMVSLQNGLQGTTTLTYGPSSAYDNTGGDGISDLPFITWVTTSILQNDGTCAPPCSGHDLTATYWYQDGRFDSATREFRGFHAVYPVDAFNNWTFNYFGQGDISKGKVLEVDTWGGSYPNLVLVRKEINSWQTASLANTRSTQLWLRERDSYTCDLNGGGSCTAGTLYAHALYSYNDQPDAYGNITHTYSIGNSGERQDTYVEYATPYLSAVHDKPKHTWSTGTGSTGTVAEKWFCYDAANCASYGSVVFGNLKDVYTWLDQTTGASTVPCPTGSGSCTHSTMAYDSYGNITDAYDGNGHQTHTVYDTNRSLYPYQDTVYPGDEAALTTTTTTDYRWGKPLTVSDPNNATTQYQYDYFGRLSQVTRPLDTQYSVQYQYHFASQVGQLSWIQVQQREPNQTGSSFSGTSVAQTPGYITTTQYFDALGRRRHTATLRVVNGTDKQVISGCTTYDAGGRTAAVYDPYINSATGDPNILCTASSGITNPNNGVTTYDYLLNGSGYNDPLGRIHTTYKLDSKTVTTLYNGLYRTDIDEEGNSTLTQANDHGWATRKGVYYGVANLSNQTANRYTYTDYTYDGAGRLKTTTQYGNSNTTITITYDSLGRKTQMTDPDSGTWVYRYDAVGNLVSQEDPNPNQHVQFAYDGINRVTDKHYFSSDGYCGTTPTSSCPNYVSGLHIQYTYGSTSDGICPKGRLGMVTDASGSTAFTYDCRGRTKQTTKTVTVNSTPKTAPTSFTYDLADHVTTTTYPDNEVVTTTYNHSGQPITLASSASYVTGTQYDLFGRPTSIAHGNGTTDGRTYYGPSGGDMHNGHRLSSLTTTGPGGTYLDLDYCDVNHCNISNPDPNYPAYTPRGQLKGIVDNGPPAGNVLSNKASFTYDLGRLASATVYYTSPSGTTLTYQYDPLGRMLSKEGMNYTYSNPTKPHQATQVGSDTLYYDPNGNVYIGRDVQEYTFDKDDHLKQISTSATVVFLYDYTGHRVAKTVGSSVTRYYSDLLEGTDGQLTKYYFLGGLRIASQRVNNSQFAFLSPDAPIQVAAVPSGHAAVILVLRRDVQFGFMVAVCVVGTGLLLAPWRRKRVVGIAVRHGHVIGVIVAFSLVTLPWPMALRPLGPPTAEAQPTPIVHYHLDHLGSTQVITDSSGTPYAKIRYTPFGEERYRSTDNCGTDRYCHEFTGYDTEPISKLEYAGARFYDPQLAIFLSHDPARQFASPYTYTNWDPVNHIDPNGEFAFLIPFLVGFAIGFWFSFMQGLANGQSAGGAALSATISGGISGVTAVGLGAVETAIPKGSIGMVAFHAALVGAGGYSTYAGLAHKQYILGAVGVVSTAMGAYGLYKDAQAAGVIGAKPAMADTGVKFKEQGNPNVTAPECPPETSGPARQQALDALNHGGREAILKDLKAAHFGAGEAGGEREVGSVTYKNGKNVQTPGLPGQREVNLHVEPANGAVAYSDHMHPPFADLTPRSYPETITNFDVQQAINEGLNPHFIASPTRLYVTTNDGCYIDLGSRVRLLGR